MQKLPLAHCDRCPAKDAPIVNPEPARIKARLTLVGEGPGRTELEEGRPFSPNGPSGRLLMRGLRAIGLQRSECHITNAVPCACRDVDMAAAREACAERLHAEITEAGAPVIVPLGAWALQSVLGKGGKPQIQRWRGSVNPIRLEPGYGPAVGDGTAGAACAAAPSRAASSPKDRDTDGAARTEVSHEAGRSDPTRAPSPKAHSGLIAASGAPRLSGSSPDSGAGLAESTDRCGEAGSHPGLGARALPSPARSAEHPVDSAPVLVCPSLHPAFVMRAEGRHWAPTLEKDFERIGRYVNGEQFIPPELAPGRSIEIPRTPEEVADSLSRLKGDYLAFDVETLGLGPTVTPLVCFALSDGRLTTVVPWSTRRDGQECFWRDPSAVAGIVSSAIADRVIVTHNGPAFDHIVAARYGIIIKAWDDTLLATWALHSHMPRGLSACVQTHLDVTAWKEQEDRTADLDRLRIYNARDTLYTRLLWDYLRAELKPSTMTRTAA